MKTIRLKYGESVNLVIEREGDDIEIENMSFDTIGQRVQNGESTVDLIFSTNNASILF